MIVASFGGLNHNSLRLCLETLLRQPGLRPDRVLVSPPRPPELALPEKEEGDG